MDRKKIPVIKQKNTQKAWEAKEDLGQDGTARRWKLADCKAPDGLCGSTKSAK